MASPSFINFSGTPFVNSTIETVDINLLDPYNRLVFTKVSSRNFETWETRQFIVELLLPDASPGTPNYVVINDFQTLKKIHKPGNIYTATPRCTRTNAAYVLVKEICGSQNSPFRLDDRVDPHAYKLIFSRNNELLNVAKNWNDGQDSRYHSYFIQPQGSGIYFDAMLTNGHVNCLVLMAPVLTEKTVSTIVGSYAFLKQFMPTHGRAAGYDFLANWQQFMRPRKTYYILGGERPPTRELLGFARSKGVHMYTRVGQYFKYCL